MDNPDRRSAVEAIIGILRKVTRIVQLAPFAYLCFYAAYLLAGSFINDEMLCLSDSFMMLSPVTTVGMLVVSRLLKLCPWHKIACLLPTSSQIEGYIDSFVFTFTEQEIVIINAVIGIITIAFIVSAVMHFWDGFKKGAH